MTTEMDKNMALVKSCSVVSCSYNLTEKCHAKAITVGDSGCPCCDTETFWAEKIAMTDEIAGVGACKEHDCVYNRDLECTADGIDVRSHAGHAECATYKET